MTTILDRLFRERRVRAALRRLFDPANQDGQAILAWLAEFCRARASSIVVGPGGTIDPIAVGVAEGRREVFNELRRRALVSDEALDAAIEREVGNG